MPSLPRRLPSETAAQAIEKSAETVCEDNAVLAPDLF